MMLLKKDIPRKSTSKTFPGSHPGLQEVHIVVFPGDPESLPVLSALFPSSNAAVQNWWLKYRKILDLERFWTDKGCFKTRNMWRIAFSDSKWAGKMLISIPRLEACKLLTSRPEPEEPEPTIKETEVAPPTLAREPSVPYIWKIGGGPFKRPLDSIFF